MKRSVFYRRLARSYRRQRWCAVALIALPIAFAWISGTVDPAFFRVLTVLEVAMCWLAVANVIDCNEKARDHDEEADRCAEQELAQEQRARRHDSAGSAAVTS